MSRPASLSALPRIAAAAHTTGEYDYQLRVVCADPSELEAVVQRLKEDHGVREPRSRLILREVELDPTRFPEV
ncbi:Lrp/AsnC ligand binding domain-containing protein [Streptantibioticus rubrisoli]|uniref:Lrp/AsnC ligand binding domain-containing protein n=1 Tax=Streptantibioticus rubrisoli TaxID=1387313 RepID=A0ABT1PF93_9ACTN|nr:Lrp/AsnC ligand binding domain-containing protein [Streptantibioticus rubrisoli]MCQ4044032.1 Lrp/AsnC ligand binding domain-containing protein [Streptantibioticus rubrisoli]